MIDSCRCAAVVLMLLSQLAGGMIVICDEGSGAQSLELFPQTCCESESEPTPAPPRQGADLCESCVDVSLVVFHQPDDDRLGSGTQKPAIEATLLDTPPTRFIPGGVIARGTSPPRALPTAARLTGTVIQLC